MSSSSSSARAEVIDLVGDDEDEEDDDPTCQFTSAMSVEGSSSSSSSSGSESLSGSEEEDESSGFGSDSEEAENSGEDEDEEYLATQCAEIDAECLELEASVVPRGRSLAAQAIAKAMNVPKRSASTRTAYRDSAISEEARLLSEWVSTPEPQKPKPQPQWIPAKVHPAPRAAAAAAAAPPPKPKPPEIKKVRTTTRLKQVDPEALEGKEADDGRLILAIDPGTVNCSWSWLNAKAAMARVQLHDFTAWGGFKHAVKDYGEILVDLVRRYDASFKNTKLVAIERQGHPRRNKEVYVAIIQLAQTIRAIYPDLPVRWAEPKSVRKLFCTSGGEYETRKEASCYTDILANPAHTFAFDETFRKGKKKIYEDPYESTQLAVWAFHNQAKLFKPMEYPARGSCNDQLRETVVPVKVGVWGVPRKTLAQAAAAAGLPDHPRWHIPPPDPEAEDAKKKTKKKAKPRASKAKVAKKPRKRAAASSSSSSAAPASKPKRPRKQ